MHRKHNPFLSLTLCGISLLAIGCRNTFSDAQVQMEPNSNSYGKRADSPQSRLGGALGLAQTSNKIADGSAKATRGSNGSATAKSSSGVSLSFGDQANDSPPLSSEEERMLEEAYAKASPEIRELAKRQMAAMSQRQKQLEPDRDLSNSALIDEDPIPSLDRRPQNSTSDGAVAQASNQQSSNQQANAQRSSASSEVQLASMSSPDSTTPATTTIALGQPPAFTMPIPAAPAESTSSAIAVPANTADLAASPAPVISTPPPVAASQTPTVPADPQAADRQATGPQATDPQAVASSSPNLNSFESSSDQQLLAELINRVQKRLDANSNPDTNVHDIAAIRTLQLLAGSPDNAVQPVANWKTSEQEFLNYQMLALWQMLDPQSHPVRERRWAAVLPELRQAINHLAASAGALEVRNLAFCTEVLDYGQIKRFPTNRFQAGQLVILYMEVENFVADSLTDGFETHFQGSYQIYDTTGKRVAHQILPADQQTCNNYRRDYFIPYEFHLPDKLSSGSYRLEVTIEDVNGKTYGQASIPFDISDTK